MVNILVKELIQQFESKEVNVAQVNTEDGRTFSLSISMKISENLSERDGKNVLQKQECDTSGCMNSSPDSDRSEILHAAEFVDTGTCNVDDFLNNFNDPGTTFPIETVGGVNEDIIDEAECQSNVDSDDCNSVDVEYFVVDELIGKRFNDKTQKYEFLLRPKRYIPKNEIMWNPIDNLDNFDISLLEHGRLYIEVPDSLKLKRKEKRKRSVLQDKLLSEVNIPSGKKHDYPPSVITEHRNSNVSRKLDVDGPLKSTVYASYICPESNDATIEVDMGAIQTNFEDLVPVVPVLMDCVAFPNTESMLRVPKDRRAVKPRGEKLVYYCADCSYQAFVKMAILQHVRKHMNNNKIGKRRKINTSPVSNHKKRNRTCQNKIQKNTSEVKLVNGITRMRPKKPKPRKPTKRKTRNNRNVNPVIDDETILAEETEKTFDQQVLKCVVGTSKKIITENQSEKVEDTSDGHGPECAVTKTDELEFEKCIAESIERVVAENDENVNSQASNCVESNSEKLPEYLPTQLNGALTKKSSKATRMQLKRQKKNTKTSERLAAPEKRQKPKNLPDQPTNTMNRRRRKRCLETKSERNPNIPNVNVPKKPRMTSHDDNRVTSETKTLNAVSEDAQTMSLQLSAINDTPRELFETNTDRENEKCENLRSYKLESISLSTELKQQTRTSVPINISLSVLEDLKIDIDGLRKKKCNKNVTEHWSACECDKLPLCAVKGRSSGRISKAVVDMEEILPLQSEVSTETLPSSSARSETLENLSIRSSEDAAADEEGVNMEEILPLQSEVSTKTLPSSSARSEVLENLSISISEDAATDEEIISVVINEIIESLSSKSDEKSTNLTKSDESSAENSMKSAEKAACSLNEKKLTESRKSAEHTSSESSEALKKESSSAVNESQKSTIPSVSEDSTSVANLSDKRESDGNEEVNKENPIRRNQMDETEADRCADEVKPASKDAWVLCKFCRTTFDRTKYKKHVRARHKDMFTQCQFCTRSFMSQTSMRRHERENHENVLPIVKIPRVDLLKLSTVTLELKNCI